MNHQDAESEETRDFLSRVLGDSKPAFPIWSPLAAYEAAALLLKMLAESGAADTSALPGGCTATAELKS